MLYIKDGNSFLGTKLRAVHCWADSHMGIWGKVGTMAVQQRVS